jgi:hypothetical protein
MSLFAGWEKGMVFVILRKGPQKGEDSYPQFRHLQRAVTLIPTNYTRTSYAPRAGFRFTVAEPSSAEPTAIDLDAEITLPIPEGVRASLLAQVISQAVVPPGHTVSFEDVGIVLHPPFDPVP